MFCTSVLLTLIRTESAEQGSKQYELQSQLFRKIVWTRTCPPC